MFERIQTAPADPILGLTEEFTRDERPNKINLSVGVFKDQNGQTPVLACVKEAEKLLLEKEASKGYKPITGDPVYGRLVRELLFDSDSDLVDSGRAATAHTPGGTGALRVVADYLKKLHPASTLWLSEPTWANHPKIFEAAGVSLKTYPYFDKETNGLRLPAMLTAIEQVPRGDVVLLHACCHNPTGVDPSAEGWEQIANVLAERGAIPIVDFAYQGFAEGLEQDATGVRLLASRLPEMFVCSSFSKNFGLYNERTGSVTVIGASKEQTAAVVSQVKICIRTNYSNPPAHGGSIVSTILSDSRLRSRWLSELDAMRNRIFEMRSAFVDSLKTKAPSVDFAFIKDQRGMFSFSGLNKDQVEMLKKDHAIYIVGSGRINVAGMTSENMDRLTTAIAKVL
jgi:aspartate/tyrosine/aromatic aminotransferase